MTLLQLINGAGASAAAGGCWRVLGGSLVGSTFTSPVTLTHSAGGASSTSTFAFGDVIPGGDAAQIDIWDCNNYSFIKLEYGCEFANNPAVECGCPTGLCGDFVEYIFNIDNCCCVLPCNGDVTECTYSHDFGPGISSTTRNQFRLTSYILDGFQYLVGPVAIQFSPLINIGPYVYNRGFANTLNSIGVPGVTALYPTVAQLDAFNALIMAPTTKSSIIRLRYPTCSTFFIEVTNIVTNQVFTWDQNGYSGATFGYGVNTPIDCTTGNDC